MTRPRNSNRPHGPPTATSRRATLVSISLVSAALLPLGCGGEQGAIAAQGDASAFRMADPGSGPVDCSQDDLYEFRIIEDFEFGSATSWYASDETCDQCKLLFADLCEVPSPAVSRPSSTAPCFDVLGQDEDPSSTDGGTGPIKDVINALCVPYCGESP